MLLASLRFKLVTSALCTSSKEQGQKLDFISLDIQPSYHSGLLTSPFHFYQTLSACFIFVTAPTISFQYASLLHQLCIVFFIFVWKQHTHYLYFIHHYSISICPLLVGSHFHAEQNLKLIICKEMTMLILILECEHKYF